MCWFIQVLWPHKALPSVQWHWREVCAPELCFHYIVLLYILAQNRNHPASAKTWVVWGCRRSRLHLPSLACLPVSKHKPQSSVPIGDTSLFPRSTTEAAVESVGYWLEVDLGSYSLFLLKPTGRGGWLDKHQTPKASQSHATLLCPVSLRVSR